MKKGFQIYILICAFMAGITQLNAANDGLKVLLSDPSNLSIQLDLAKMTVKSKEVNGLSFSQVFIPNTYTIGEVGGPELPVVNQLIEVPCGAEINVAISDLVFSTRDLKKDNFSEVIFPLQVSASKNEDPEKDFIYKEELYKAYSSKRTFAQPQVKILGQMRGKQIALLSFCPVIYDAQSGIVKQITSAKIDLNFKGAIKSQKAGLASPYFETIFSQLLNHKTVDPSDLWNTPIRYIILTSRKYESAVQTLVEWKTKKGFQVEVAYKEDLGDTPELLAAWVKARYDEASAVLPAPSFLLLAGDVEDVPAFDGKYTYRKTDLYYASVDGDDFPEMFYGRISASTLAEMEQIVVKTINYEQLAIDQAEFTKRAEFIAGVDEGNNWNVKVGEPALHYAINNYFNAANGFDDVTSYLGPYTGYDSRLSEGNALVYYTGHGLETEWQDPKVTIENVATLGNNMMPSLVIANCCLSGDFGAPKSMSEAFLRHPKGGAIGYIGSSPTSYWLEDFYWGVGAFALAGQNNGYIPSIEESTDGVFDAMFNKEHIVGDALLFYGNLAVTEAHTQGFPVHKSSSYYWEAYNYSGDPSVEIILGQPEPMVAECRDIALNADRAFITGEAGAYVGLSKDNVLLGAGIIGENGRLEMIITPVDTECDIDMVVSKKAKQTLITKAHVVIIDDAFCQMESFRIKDTDGNIVSKMKSNTTYKLEFEIKNFGLSMAEEVTIAGEAKDDYILIPSTDAIVIGNIEAGSSVWATAALNIQTASFVPDQAIAQFQLNIHAKNDDWNNAVSGKIDAPKIRYIAFFENKGLPFHGIHKTIVYEMENIGHAELAQANAQIQLEGVQNTIEQAAITIEALAIGAKASAKFDIEFGSDLDYVRIASEMKLSAVNFKEEILPFVFSYEVFDDFESGDLSMNKYNFSDDSKKWYVSKDDKFKGKYSLKSPKIDDNGSNGFSTVMRFTDLGEISFASYIELEDVNDVFSFSIDDEVVGSWSGVQQWQKYSFRVEPGLHTFTWNITKDVSGGLGADAVWIDEIHASPYLVYQDQEGPELAKLLGNYAAVNTAFKLKLTLRDTQNIFAAKAYTQIDGVEKEWNLNQLERGISMLETEWELNLDAFSEPKQARIKFTFEDSKGFITNTKVYPLIASNIQNVTEDFETGDFSKLNWSFEGDANWSVQDFEGTKTAVSGAINHQQTTSLKLTENWAIDGDFSFDFKVSTEQVYDKLQLFVDGVLVNTWSGVYDWRTHPVLPMAAGEHEILWVYTKDSDNSSASDCIYLDNLVLNGLDAATVFPTNQMPVFNSSPIESAEANKVYAYELNVSDPDGDMLTVEAKQLPYWLKLTQEDGVYRLGGIPVASGIYEVILSLSDGYNEVLQSFTITVSVGTVGVDEIKLSSVQLYPMPVQDVLYIGKTCTKISLLSVQGGTLKSKENSNTLDLTNIPAGIYLLKLQIHGNQIIKKIVKN